MKRRQRSSAKRGLSIAKRMLTIVIKDDMVDDVVQTIIETNQTGKPGDGKIFVLPVGDSVRVRTGEKGEKSIV